MLPHYVAKKAVVPAAEWLLCDASGSAARNAAPCVSVDAYYFYPAAYDII